MIHTAHRIPKNVLPPRPTRLVTPAEKGYTHETPQCKVWTDAQRLGIELIWTSEYTLTVRNEGGLKFEFDPMPPKMSPIEPLGEHCYGVHTYQHVRFPLGLGGLILPHPRFYDPLPDGCYNDAPAVIPGFLEMDWWPRGLYLVCSLPKAGTEHVFHAGEPFCQLVPVPLGEMTTRPMDDEEVADWEACEGIVDGLTGNGDTYESIAARIRKVGWAGLRKEVAVE